MHERSTTFNMTLSVLTAPSALPEGRSSPKVYLGGSIDLGAAPNWQADVIAALEGEDVIVLNPRRPDWNPDWAPEASEPHFRQQVEWELAALEGADVIILHLAAETKSPISLLELGLHASSGKLLVHCAEGYWRKGNVDITADRYGVERVDTIGELIAAVRRRIQKVMTGQQAQAANRKPPSE
jgi:hypothetical protein